MRTTTRTIIAVFFLALLTPAYGLPPIPNGQQCVIIFAAGSPSSTTTGTINVSTEFNMLAGWSLDYIEVNYYKWNANANNHIAPNQGVLAASHRINPPAITVPNQMVDALVGLNPGDKYTVTVLLFVKNGKLKSGDVKSAPDNPNFIIVSN